MKSNILIQSKFQIPAAILLITLFISISTVSVAEAYCCKVCSKGKACGDSCIARHKTCHKGYGCACDG